MKPSRVDLWAVSVLYLSTLAFIICMVHALTRDSSTLWAWPSIITGAVAIINLREK